MCWKKSTAFSLWKPQTTSGTLNRWQNKWTVLKFTLFISQASQIQHCLAPEGSISTWDPAPPEHGGVSHRHVCVDYQVCSLVTHQICRICLLLVIFGETNAVKHHPSTESNLKADKQPAQMALFLFFHHSAIIINNQPAILQTATLHSVVKNAIIYRKHINLDPLHVQQMQKLWSSGIRWKIHFTLFAIGSFWQNLPRFNPERVLLSSARRRPFSISRRLAERITFVTTRRGHACLPGFLSTELLNRGVQISRFLSDKLFYAVAETLSWSEGAISEMYNMKSAEL